MKALTERELRQFFESIEVDYDVRLPIGLHDGTRTLGKLSDGPLMLAGGALPGKPTSVFFPQMQRILVESEGGFQEPTPPEKPLFVVGYTAADLDCLEFVDRFFSTDYRDDIYFSRRDGAVIVCVSGKCGQDGEFLRIAGKDCDIELVSDGQKYIAMAYSEVGKALVERAKSGVPASEADVSALRDESDNLKTDDADLISAASELILQEKVPEDFWQAVGDRCIACTACNLVCPTCTCFDVFDREADGKIERWRMWDSCQLDGFMREASGHNPMGQEWSRTRRRLHHKLAADVTRWGHVTCFLCGRCDKVCPSNIGIKSVCREIVEKYGTRPAPEPAAAGTSA